MFSSIYNKTETDRQTMSVLTFRCFQLLTSANLSADFRCCPALHFTKVVSSCFSKEHSSPAAFFSINKKQFFSIHNAPFLQNAYALANSKVKVKVGKDIVRVAPSRSKWLKLPLGGLIEVRNAVQTSGRPAECRYTFVCGSADSDHLQLFRQLCRGHLRVNGAVWPE